MYKFARIYYLFQKVEFHFSLKIRKLRMEFSIMSVQRRFSRVLRRIYMSTNDSDTFILILSHLFDESHGSKTRNNRNERCLCRI